MKKVVLSSVICIAIMTFSICAIAADAAIKVNLDNKDVAFDVSPQIVNGRTMVPLRKIFETLNINVTWDDATKKITGKKDGLTIVLQIDNQTASINGKDVILDTPATIIDGRTLVPVRFLAESTGSKVSWDNETKTVSINTWMDGEIVEFRGLKIPTSKNGINAAVINDANASFASLGVFKWHIIFGIMNADGTKVNGKLDDKFNEVERVLKQKYSDKVVEELMRLVKQKKTFEQGALVPAARVVNEDLILVYRPSNKGFIEILFADFNEAKSKGAIEQLKKSGAYNEGNAILESIKADNQK